MSRRVDIWGVVNVTPDSFSDGGHYLDPGRAISHGRELAAQGADVIDVGGESTRPGATPITVSEEIDRLRPVVTELLDDGLVVSVDTMRAETAREAISWGVPIINDVSGGLCDPDMLPVIANSSVRFVLMHWRSPSATMDDHARYDNVVSEVADHLTARVDAAAQSGVDPSRITVDPGFGFSKTPEHNWELCRQIANIVSLGFPVLAGVSRKRFIASLFPAGHEMADRDEASAMVGAVLAQRGVSALRVHSVMSQHRALEIMRQTGEAAGV